MLGFGTFLAGSASPSSSLPFALAKSKRGQSNAQGTNNVDDMSSGYQFVSAGYKFANLGFISDPVANPDEFVFARAVKTGNTIAGVTGPANEYLATSGISRETGIARLFDLGSIAPGVTEIVSFKNTQNGTPQTSHSPGGGVFNGCDTLIHDTGGAYVAANDTRWLSDDYDQHEKEIENAVTAAQAANGGSSDQAVIMPVVAADPTVVNWGDLLVETRRACREYHGIATAPFIFGPSVLPALGGVYANLEQRGRELVVREMMNLSRYVVMFDGTVASVIDIGPNRYTATWNTATDAPIFTDTTVADPRKDDYTYTIFFRGGPSPDNLHWAADSQIALAIAEKAVYEHRFGVGGIPPENFTVTAIKPIFYTVPEIVGAPTETSVEVEFAASRVGTAHVAVYAAGSPVPTAAQVVAGTGTGFIAKGTVATIARTLVSKVVEGLTGDTSYSVHVVIVEGGVNSVTSSGTDFVTAEPAPPGGGTEPKLIGRHQLGSGSNIVLNLASLVDVEGNGLTWAAGDYAYIFCETADEIVTAPTGTVALPDLPLGNNGGVLATSTAGTRLSGFWRKLIGGDTTFTIADPGNHCEAVLLVFRQPGVVSGDPWDDTAVTITTIPTVTTAVAFPAVTTAGVDRRILNVASTSADIAAGVPQASGWTNASLSSIIELNDENTNAGNGGGVHSAAGTLAVAGSSGSTAMTLATLSGYCAYTIALRP